MMKEDVDYSKKRIREILGGKERNKDALDELARLLDEYYGREIWAEININLRDGVVQSIVKTERTRI